MFNSPAAALQLLDGRKLHVLVALLVLRDQLPVSEMRVASMVGCSRKTARSHLRALETLGIVAHRGEWMKRPWTLSDGAEQIPLPLLWPGNDGVFLENETKHNSEGKSYPHRPSSTSSSSIEGRMKTFEEEEEKTISEGKSYPHQNENVDRLRKVGVIKALEGSGIGRNMWQRIGGLEWVTAEYIEAHVWLAKRNGDPVNYLVQRILAGDAMPTITETAVCERCGAVIDEWAGRCYCDVIKR